MSIELVGTNVCGVVREYESGVEQYQARIEIRCEGGPIVQCNQNDLNQSTWAISLDMCHLH